MALENAGHFFPDLEIFQENFNQGKTQLVGQWVPADLETPVSAYLKLCGYTSYSFLFESVEGGANLGRYSIIGTNPDLLWKYSKSEGVLIKQNDDVWRPENISTIDSLKKNINQSTLDYAPEDLPPMCTLGLFGYVGYDMVRLSEDIPDKNPDDLHVPDSILMRPNILAVFDNVKNMICIITPIYNHRNNSDLPAQIIYREACIRVEKAIKLLNSPLDRTLLEHTTHLSTPLPIQSNTQENIYKGAVKQAIEYIKAGEIFQVVPSQRFSVSFDLPAFELYRSLRSINPSPFLFYLSFDGFSIVGSSPEILVRVRDNTVTIRPIAGTRKRGKTNAENQALEQDLLADPKECSEHLMLLDLGRNDVGRVSEIGTVTVTDQFSIEHYSHVMHIVSNVEGQLRHDLDIIDALIAGFPAGTVTGAPKIRAMEIIDELEISRRGIYAGGVGYFSRYNMDSCIALRTAVVKDGKVYVQAGAGVVADSDPDAEHQECFNKAKAVLQAAEMAIDRFRRY